MGRTLGIQLAIYREVRPAGESGRRARLWFGRAGNRAGSYNTSFYQGIAQAMDQQAPFSKSLSLSNSATSPLTLASGFNSAASGTTADTFAVDPNIRVGYSQIYGASVQQNVTSSLVMTVGYIGTKGSTLQEFQPNTYLPGVPNPCPSCLAGYTYLQSSGTASRNAGQVTLRRRFHAGFQTNLTYTYAKAIDDSGSLLSYGGSTSNGGSGSLGSASCPELARPGGRARTFEFRPAAFAQCHASSTPPA